jgi:hypothetical protein
MVDRRKLVGGALLAALALWGIWAYATLEKRRVRARFEALAEWVDKEPAEAPLEKVGKARVVNSIFADPCRFEIQAYEISAEVPLEQLAGLALQGRERFASLELKFYDLKITFPEEGQSLVTATGRLSGTKVGGDPINETHEVECALAKGDEGWRFTRITAVQVLQK